MEPAPTVRDKRLASHGITELQTLQVALGDLAEVERQGRELRPQALECVVRVGSAALKHRRELFLEDREQDRPYVRKRRSGIDRGKQRVMSLVRVVRYKIFDAERGVAARSDERRVGKK